MQESVEFYRHLANALMQLCFSANLKNAL